MPKYGRNS